MLLHTSRHCSEYLKRWTQNVATLLESFISSVTNDRRYGLFFTNCSVYTSRHTSIELTESTIMSGNDVTARTYGLFLWRIVGQYFFLSQRIITYYTYFIYGDTKYLQYAYFIVELNVRSHYGWVYITTKNLGIFMFSLYKFTELRNICNVFFSQKFEDRLVQDIFTISGARLSYIERCVWRFGAVALRLYVFANITLSCSLSYTQGLLEAYRNAFVFFAVCIYTLMFIS